MPVSGPPFAECCSGGLLGVATIRTGSDAKPTGSANWWHQRLIEGRDSYTGVLLIHFGLRPAADCDRTQNQPW